MNYTLQYVRMLNHWKYPKAMKLNNFDRVIYIHIPTCNIYLQKKSRVKVFFSFTVHLPAGLLEFNVK